MNKNLFYLLSLMLFSCAVKKTETNSQTPLHYQLNSEFNKQHHVGFILKDLQTGQVVFEQNADKNFSVSSNIRLFTLFTALNTLQDSVPSFQYIVKGDSLVLWPMGDPTFLHPDFAAQPAFDFLKNSGKNIYLVNGRYKGQKYGNGWPWDNYSSGNQTEIRDFPIYGNVISYMVKPNGTARLCPDLPSLFYAEITEDARAKSVRRSLSGNNLYVPTNLPTGYVQRIPIVFNKNLTESLLTDTLLASGYATTSVVDIPWKPVAANAKQFYNSKASQVYKELLNSESNLIAEHLMLNCAVSEGGEMSLQAGKDIAKKYLQGIVNEKNYLWVDASGLSSDNIASPRTLVNLLEKIRHNVADDVKLLAMFPQYLAEGKQPYVFAQLGKARAVYNLSGYIMGKSGKKYAFSYLNNHLLKPEAEIKSEIEKNLLLVHSNF